MNIFIILTKLSVSVFKARGEMGLIHELTFLFTMNRRLPQQDNTQETEFTELWEPSTPKQLQFQGCTSLLHYV